MATYLRSVYFNINSVEPVDLSSFEEIATISSQSKLPTPQNTSCLTNTQPQLPSLPQHNQTSSLLMQRDWRFPSSTAILIMRMISRRGCRDRETRDVLCMRARVGLICRSRRWRGRFLMGWADKGGFPWSCFRGQYRIQGLRFRGACYTRNPFLGKDCGRFGT